MWPNPGLSLTFPLLSNTIWLFVMFEWVRFDSCIKLRALRTCLAKFWRVFSGKAPTDATKFYKLDFTAKSYTIETHPSGLFQNVSWILINWSETHICSQTAIHSLIICRDSLLASGTSLIHTIFSVGPWSIFLIVPDVDLYTDSVII